MLASARLLLHVFLALPSATSNYKAHPHIVTTLKAVASSFSNDNTADDVPSTKKSFASTVSTLFAATTIIAAASAMAAPVSNAITGTVVEGPSNAEMLELTLKPGEKMLADTGTFLYMSDGVSLAREYRSGAVNRFSQGGRLDTTVYTNDDPQKTATVAVAPGFPSRVLPVQLEKYGNTIIGNVHSFLAAPYDVELGYSISSLEGPGLFNYWLRMERVSGKGTIYLTGSGNIFAKQLGKGEKLKLYAGAWVAMTDHMEMDFKARSNIYAQSLLEVEGPGTIWIDTSPIQRIVNEMDERLPKH